MESILLCENARGLETENQLKSKLSTQVCVPPILDRKKLVAIFFHVFKIICELFQSDAIRLKSITNIAVPEKSCQPIETVFSTDPKTIATPLKRTGTHVFARDLTFSTKSKHISLQNTKFPIQF